MIKSRCFSGEEWELAGGWTLVARQIDVEGNKVWLELKKNGEILDSAIVSATTDMTRPQKTYIYKNDDDFPLFYCYIDSIFRGSTSDFVTIKYASLRDNFTTIEKGDTYGTFDVTSFEIPAVMNGTNYAGTGSGTILNTGDPALVLSNNDEVILDPDELIDLYGGMYIKTENTRGSSLKMTLCKTCSITIPDQVSGKEIIEKGIIEEETENVAVTDMRKKSETLSSAQKETINSTFSGNETTSNVESSMKLPGIWTLNWNSGNDCSI